MKLRYRLTLGIGFLFALILLLGIQSVSYVRQLSKSSKEILADNYNSLHYAKICCARWIASPGIPLPGRP